MFIKVYIGGQETLNPNDAVGSFCGDLMVGWVDVSEDGWTTLPMMGQDGPVPGCDVGEVPTFKIYSHVSDAIFDAIPGVPELHDGIVPFENSEIAVVSSLHAVYPDNSNIYRDDP